MIHKQLTSLLYSLNLKLNNFEQQLISLFKSKRNTSRLHPLTYNENGGQLLSPPKNWQEVIGWPHNLVMEKFSQRLSS